MKRLLPGVLSAAFVFTGCSVSNVMYNSKGDRSFGDTQYLIHEKCSYFIGPFNTSDHFTVEDTVKEAVETANEEGYFGDELINVKVEETGYTAIVFSRYCVKVEGNLSYSDLK